MTRTCKTAGSSRSARWGVAVGFAFAATAVAFAHDGDTARGQSPRPDVAERALSVSAESGAEREIVVEPATHWSLDEGVLLPDDWDALAWQMPAVDARRYARIFEMQARGDWTAADREIARLTDRRLMGHVTAQRLLLKAGMIVDATIIAAPSSTKNATHARDPEMKQTRKGQQWHFGMKIHVGTDTRGVVHSLTTTDAAVADISQLTHLVRGSETTLFGDKAYYKTEHQLHWEASGGRYRVNNSGKRTTHGNRINATRSWTRARVEHAVRIVKQLWGFAKVRYREPAKNTTRTFAAFALSNLYLLRHRLTPQGT